MIVACPQCCFENLPEDKFWGECGHALALPSKPIPQKLPFDEKMAKIQKYLPSCLTEKILSQKGKVEKELR